ncbi:MAG: hypothetical protein JWN72_2371 [Thermoleophilia bacterium]|nr:hypothetical protein [Thermoleophilia bacterium]
MVNIELSPKTIDAFVTLCTTHGDIRSISELMNGQGFDRSDVGPEPDVGIREHVARSYLGTHDVLSSESHSRLLKIMVKAISEWSRAPNGEITSQGRSLLHCLRADGVPITDNGELMALAGSDAFDVRLPHLVSIGDESGVDRVRVRLSALLADDPAAAIGSAKELVEAMSKLVLDAAQIEYSRRDSLLDLFKRALSELEPISEGDPEYRAARKVATNLATAVQSLAELRNMAGTGHGRISEGFVEHRHARLAANAARVVVEFLHDAWVHRELEDVYRHFDSAINAYVSSRPASTADTYRSIVSKFAKFVAPKGPTEVSAEDCRRWAEHRSSRAVKTRQLDATAISGFFEWLKEQRYIAASPWQIVRPRDAPSQPLRTDLSDVEVESLLSAAVSDAEKLCLHVLVGTGASREGASRLRWADVDFSRSTIRIAGRGGEVITQRMTITSPKLLDVLKGYRETHSPAGNEYVIPNRGVPQGENRSSRVIYALVKDVAARAGMTGVDPKGFKPAFARSYISRNGDDLSGLKTAMGLTNFGQLERYIPGAAVKGGGG